MAQDRGWWRTLVNTVMNLRVLAPRIYFIEKSLKQENDRPVGDGAVYSRKSKPTFQRYVLPISGR
jgi:hypothetical protein